MTEPAEIYVRMRQQALRLRPEEVGAAAGSPVAVVMEWRERGIPVMLLCVADGSTSLYFGNGGGVIGCGAHLPVRAASVDFRTRAAQFAPKMTDTSEVPLPDEGRVRFYLVHGDRTLTAEAAENELGYNRHALSPLFHEAHRVIAAVRKSTPPGT